MSASAGHEQKNGAERVQRKWWVLGIGAAVCALSWVALGLGLALGFGFTAKLVLATLAAVSTEGFIWLTALVLGMRAYEVRRRLMQRIRALVGAGGGNRVGEDR